MYSAMSANARGMLAMLGAGALFTVNDALVKLATSVWPVSQVMTYRGFLAVLMSLALVLAMDKAVTLRWLANPLVVLRSALEGGLSVLFILSLATLPLADLTAIMMLSPLMLTAVAAVILKETVGIRRWCAVLAGFTGMLLVVQPGSSAHAAGYEIAALLGLGSVLGVAARDLVTRRLDGAAPASVVLVGNSVGSFVAGCLLAPFEAWRPAAVEPMIGLVASAALLAAGSYLVIQAFRIGELSAVAPLRYMAVLFSIIVGALVFGDFPNVPALCGIATIVASGVYLLHRERVLRALPRSASDPS